MSQQTENPVPVPETPPVPIPEAGGPPTETASLDRLRAENDELRLRLRLTDARRHVTEALRSAGARSPELLFEASKGDLAFAEDDTVQNEAALIDSLREKFPEQFGSPNETLSIDGGAGSHTTASFLTKEALAKMKPAEIAKLDWSDVRRALGS